MHHLDGHIDRPSFSNDGVAESPAEDGWDAVWPQNLSERTRTWTTRFVWYGGIRQTIYDDAICTTTAAVLITLTETVVATITASIFPSGGHVRLCVLKYRNHGLGEVAREQWVCNQKGASPQVRRWRPRRQNFHMLGRLLLLMLSFCSPRIIILVTVLAQQHTHRFGPNKLLVEFTQS